jgi:polyhydroxyalkanoate synthase
MGQTEPRAPKAKTVADPKLEHVANFTRHFASATLPITEVISEFIPEAEHSAAVSEFMDRTTHAAMSKMTKGASPAAFGEAYLDWLVHLSTSPGKQLELSEKAFRKWLRLSGYVMSCAQSGGASHQCIEPLPQDTRFSGEAWQKWPYNAFYQSFLMNQQWWHNATTGVRGVTDQHETVLEFMGRQILDVFSPANFLLTNPEALAKTREEGGQNLVRGFQTWLEDLERQKSDAPPPGAEAFRPGHEVAATPGKVVFRNRLIELIQYSPTTEKVRPEPVLIVPSWIMKYYILDLSPHNSMMKYLVSQGYTVFMISWHNPDAKDRELGMDDYRKMGVMAAISAVQAATPGEKIHGVGYCLGGTLLAIAAAAIGRQDDDPFASQSYFASQIDFTEPGELQLFINESQLTFLEDMMWEQGYLDTNQMSGAFQMIGSADLLWSKVIHKYLMGESANAMFDLMAWNADGTRLPFRMHSEYLRSLYLNNDLTEGHFLVDGHPVSVTDIKTPVFCVGTVKDHVAPWYSVYKMHLYLDTELTFVLASGGHNAGIVSEPGHANRTYQIATAIHGDRYIDPDSWSAKTPTKEGSWWEEWASWLGKRSGEPVTPPPMGHALADAPGTYIFEK